MDATDNRLLLIVERIERLMEERKGITQDIRGVFAEAKAVGYDTRIIRQVIARRAMKPDARQEIDAQLEVYEAAIGFAAEDPAVSPEESQRELAIAILAEQVEGISDPDRAAHLAEHVAVILDLRAEIAMLRTQENYQKKRAEADGFEKNPLSALIRWIEKCAKHGTDTMRAGEAVFQLYRGTIEARGVEAAAPVSSDPKLQGAFGKPAPKSKAAARNAAWLETGMGD